MGTVAAIERGYRADAGLVPEPTMLNLWVATRGLLHGSVHGARAVGARRGQPAAVAGRRRRQRDRARVAAAPCARRRERPLGRQAPPAARRAARAADDRRRRRVHLERPRVVHRSHQRDVPARGRGRAGLRQRAARPDPRGGRGRGRRLAGRPTRRAGRGRRTTRRRRSTTARGSWRSRAAAAQAAGGGGALEGIDTTYDGALLTRLAGVPSPALGPGDLGRAHAPDEWVGIDELRAGARAYVRAIAAWCGVERSA